ncbi:uncharacterized protein LOC120678348 isoform X4 [Panicum virgatum]|uniref:uncharacterized protein LOC120678348 isoform X4 n=1 Tax=Panicum virgatum TaxID=38727 RepID=UPI0019D5795E|nr:uncharacterized protein LOC120678348 isoform X4 [Panicum virgatum]
MVQWLQFMGLQHLTASSAAGGIGAGGPPRRRPRTSSSTRTSRPCSPTSGSRMGSLGCWALEYDRSGQATVKSDSVHRRGGARAAHLREEGRRHQQAFDQAERGHPVQMAQQTIEQALALCRKVASDYRQQPWSSGILWNHYSMDITAGDILTEVQQTLPWDYSTENRRHLDS